MQSLVRFYRPSPVRRLPRSRNPRSALSEYTRVFIAADTQTHVNSFARVFAVHKSYTTPYGGSRERDSL